MTVTQRTLDWHPHYDARSRKYAIRTLLKQRSVENKRKMWEEGVVLDQGSEGACVGFAWTGELLAQPQAPEKQPSFKYGNELARSFYLEAQKIDEWPGENYSGTSVLAGAKIMQQRGFIGEYRCCFNLNDIKESVISEGPVVFGTP